jgi:hypothetical protein
MTSRPSQHRASGIHTYYVASDSHASTEYTVQHIRRPGMCRWHCSCPQFFYRCVVRRRVCKHVHFVQQASRKVAQAA